MKSNTNFYTFNSPKWKEKLLHWANVNFPFLAYTTGNQHNFLHGPFPDQLFLGYRELPEVEVWNEKSWKVGVIGYDLKNSLENLQSKNQAYFSTPELCFFSPEWNIQIHEKSISSEKPFPSEWIQAIENQELSQSPNLSCEVYPLLSQEEYLKRVENIQQEILEGNTYEANFCQAYVGKFNTWDPIQAFFRLNKLSKMPFAALFKANSTWLVSASPERFLKKKGQKLIAQPIKGTISRGVNPEEDQKNSSQLRCSEKERAENLMITDLMRNDLARVSKTGSVRVEELFGIYPLPRVFQMISTISAELRPDATFQQIIQATFPMGSMTGAPKISTMEIIDREENFMRGWFSGAFGWVDEEGDFDFSVVIRSIIADLQEKKLYVGVGSAITIDASPNHEYEECALKAQAIFELLRGN